MTGKEILIKILQDRPVAYHPDIAKIAKSVTAGVFLSQLIYWTGKEKDPNGWMYKTGRELYDETGLSRRNQETARRKLISMKILKEKLTGNPARLFYMIDFNYLIKELSSLYGSDNPQTEQTSMSENDKLSLTEITSENTPSLKHPVWTYWKKKAPPYDKTKLTKTKIGQINATIKDYSESLLIEAIDNMCEHKWSIENKMVRLNRLIDTKDDKRYNNIPAFTKGSVKKKAPLPLPENIDDKLQKIYAK